MKKTLNLLFGLVLIFGTVHADIIISGDARVRPRLDLKDYGEYGASTSDVYYLYRARLNLTADIGNDYFFKTTLGHNGVAYWIGGFGTGDLPSSSSLSSAGRGSVDFMKLYFGYNGKSYGWAGGLIPVRCSPLTDLHFYPSKVVDIPWEIFNNSAAHGFDFYYYLADNKLNLQVLVDNNSGLEISEADTAISFYLNSSSGTIDSLITVTDDSRDQYSFNLTYSVKIGGVTLTPQLLLTIADDGDPAPVTYGTELVMPRIAGIRLSSFVGMTQQEVEETDMYSGWIGRWKIAGKIGPGELVAWYDMARITPDDETVALTDFSYLWLSYKYKVHQSDMGEVSFKPTCRLISRQTDGSLDYSQAKIELTTEIKFK